MAGGKRKREVDLNKFRAVSKPADYSSLASRKQLIEKKFKNAAKAYASAGREDAWIGDEKRKAELLKTMDRARAELSSLRLRSFEETLVDFEIMCTTNYNWLQDDYNYILGAAIWILDELRKNGRLIDAYRFLPSSRMDIDEVYTPLDFYHPCYEDDLIQSVAWIIDPKNSTGDGWDSFDGLLNLIDGAHIGRALIHFKDLQWKATGLYLQCMEYYDGKYQRMIQEFENLLQPNVLRVHPISEKEKEIRTREISDEMEDITNESASFTSHFEDYLGTRERRIMDRRELAKIMSDFRIENPFEICFALVCMRGLKSDQIWSIKAGTAVISVAGRMLPWYQPEEDDWDEQDEDDDDWDDPWEPMSFDRGTDWLTASDAGPDLEKMYTLDRDGWNLAQMVYKLSRGMMPVGFHPFREEREQLKEDGEELADLIADQAEVLFLSSFQAKADNLQGTHWWDHDMFSEEEENDEEPVGAGNGDKTEAKLASAENGAASLIKARGMRDRGDEEQGRAAAAEEVPETSDSKKSEGTPKKPLAEQIENAKREIKNLKKALSEISREAGRERVRYEREMKTLRHEHRELADLRELVFNQQSADQARIEKPKKNYSFPYKTKKRTVVFGGHDSFLRAIKPMLPEVKFVDGDSYGFDPQIIRNADAVWVQTNCISHSQYGIIASLTRKYDVQLRYFGFASAGKCAEQLIDWDSKA